MGSGAEHVSGARAPSRSRKLLWLAYDSLRLASRLKPASRSFYGGGVSYGGLRRLTADWRIIYSVSQTPTPPPIFSDVFPKRFGVFSPNFTRLLYVPIYAGLQIFIQLSATLTQLCHIKRDHHYMLKTSTIG